MNIRFEYLYRDAGNFKNWGEVVFLNRNDHDACSLEERMKSVLISGEFFVAEKVDIPSLRFKEYVESLDHGWHEFHSIEATSLEVSDQGGRDIAELIESLEMVLGE